MKKTDPFALIVLIMVCLVWLLLGIPVYSQNSPPPVFHDDFQGGLGDNWLAGGKPAGAATTTVEPDGAYYELAPDTNNLFGKGATHQVLLVHDFSNTKQVNLVANGKFDLGVLTLSFDFYQASDPQGGALVIRLGNGSNADSEKVLSINLDHGKLQNIKNAYTFDVKHHLDLVANNSNAAVSYGGTYAAAPQTFDVWLDGFPVLMGQHMQFLANLGGATELTSLSFLTYTAATIHAEFLIDDVSVTGGAVVTPAVTKPAAITPAVTTPHSP